VDKQYKIETDVSADGLVAKLKVIPTGENADLQISVEDLHTSLKDAGITSGIKQDALKGIGKEKILNEWMIIAEADAPHDGKDGEVHFHFSREKPTVHLREDASGRVNLWDLNIIQNVNKGDLLCELIAPEPGKRGKTVRGEEIPAQDGKPTVLPKGTNVDHSQEGNKLFASVSGMVTYDGEKIVVEPVYTVEKVDAATGNIRFVGSVVVSGEVGDGFEVHAGEDLSIGMSVGHVTLCAGGEIKISGGIIKGSIDAGKDFRAKFIQDANVNAKGSVIVDDYIQNSEVIADGPVVVKNTQGWIMGGVLSSEQWIYAQKIGKEDGSINTDVIIGSHPNLLHVRENLVEEIYNRMEDFLRFRSSIIKLRALQSRGPLAPKQEKLYQKIIRAIDFVRSELLTKQATADSIKDRIHRTYSGEIYVPGAAYGGTAIHIGGKRKDIEKLSSSARFFLDEGQIKEAAFAMKKEIEALLGK